MIYRKSLLDPRFFLFPAMPLHVLRPPSINMHDQRLLDPSSFSHKWESWRNLYGEDIFESIGRHGQIDPNIALYENGGWRVEPGQARWLAMHFLGMMSQKVLLCVREHDNANDFFMYEHDEIPEEKLEDIFAHKAQYRGYDYIQRRFKKGLSK